MIMVRILGRRPPTRNCPPACHLSSLSSCRCIISVLQLAGCPHRGLRIELLSEDSSQMFHSKFLQSLQVLIVGNGAVGKSSMIQRLSPSIFLFVWIYSSDIVGAHSPKATRKPLALISSRNNWGSKAKRWELFDIDRRLKHCSARDIKSSFPKMWSD